MLCHLDFKNIGIYLYKYFYFLCHIEHVLKLIDFLNIKEYTKISPIYTLPAFQKQGDNQLTANMLLQTIADIKLQIVEAMRLFEA